MTDFDDVGADFEFFAAIENGRVEDVARLLIFERSTRPRDINRRLNGWAPLLFAIQLAAIRSTSRYDIVRLLLDCGADVNRANSGPGYTNGLGWTPLLLAIRYENTEIVHQLLDRGADVDRADNLGFTPLLLACQKGDVDLARILLDRDADVNKASSNNARDTPLLLATMRGHSDIARLLLQHGAAVDTSNNYGHTPLSFATSLGYPDVVRVLLRAGASVNHRPLANLSGVGRGGLGCGALALARELRAVGLAFDGSTADLVIKAAGPWSPTAHTVRPAAARARAVAIVRVGYHIAFRREHGPIRTPWRERVMAFIDMSDAAE